MDDFLDPGVDRDGMVPGPVRSPAPAHPIGVQGFTFQVQQRNLDRGGDVVLRQLLVTHGVDQGVGHAQRRDEVVNAPVL
ncbi:hypothetical protein D3C71_1788050 [compost metagenome]